MVIYNILYKDTFNALAFENVFKTSLALDNNIIYGFIAFRSTTRSGCHHPIFKKMKNKYNNSFCIQIIIRLCVHLQYHRRRPLSTGCDVAGNSTRQN